MLSQYTCVMIGHYDQQIIGICENVSCKQQYRRVCFDCQQIHQANDSQFKLTDIKNDKGIQKIIDEFKQDNLDKINNIYTQSYIQQYFLTLQMIKSIEQYLIKFSQFANIIDNLNKFQTEEWTLANTTDYLLNEKNMGIYQYLQFFYIRGNLLSYLGRKKEALIDYDKAIEINQIYADAYYKRGILLSDLGRKEEALIDYNKVIKINPINADAYYNRGIILSDLSRKEEALIDYNKAIEINPINADAYYNSGLYQVIQAERKRLQVILIRLLRLIQQYDLGLSLHNLKCYEEAIQMYNHGIQLNKKYSKTYINKGYSLINLKRYEEADLSFSKSIEIKNFK